MCGRGVVLDRAEVVHLLAAGEVEGDLAGAAAGPDDAGLGEHPGVVAAEGDRGQRDGGIPIADGLLVTDLPRRLGELVDAEVAHPGGLSGAHLDDGHDEHDVAVGRGEPLDDGDLAVGAGVDDEAGEHGVAVTGDLVGDHDGLGHHRAGGDLDDDRRHERRVQLAEEVRRLGQDDVGQLAEVGAVDDDAGATLDRGRRRTGAEPVELQFVDAAVAPDLLGGGGQLGGGGPLRRGDPEVDERLVGGARRIGGEGVHRA